MRPIKLAVFSPNLGTITGTPYPFALHFSHPTHQRFAREVISIFKEEFDNNFVGPNQGMSEDEFEKKLKLVSKQVMARLATTKNPARFLLETGVMVNTI